MKTSAFVVDACAILALINREPGHNVVLELLKKAENDSVIVRMHVVNLCEVYTTACAAAVQKWLTLY